MWPQIFGILLILLLCGIFILTYLLNKRTPRPEGSAEVKNCHGCNDAFCSNHPSHYSKEE